MKKYALYVAWVVALSGLLISFFFGEVLNNEPCRLCWYQRMALFPLVIFLGFANYQNQPKIALPCLPLALFGGLVALYQSLSIVFPALHSPALCGQGHCTEQSFLRFLSLIGFSLIAFLIRIVKKGEKISCK